MTTHKIKKGFDLPLAGRAEQVLADALEPTEVGLETAEFAGIKPKVLVKEGDQVKTGQPIFLNKLDRDIVWCSPVTGVVKSVEFGERRFLRCRERPQEDQRAVVPAKTQVLRDRHVDAPRLRAATYIVQVAVRVRRLEVYRGRADAMFDGQTGQHGLDAAGGGDARRG